MRINHTDVRTQSVFTSTIIAFTITSLVVVGGFFLYKHEKETIIIDRHNELSAIAQLKVKQLVDWHRERISEALFFSQNTPYKNYVQGAIDGNDAQKALLRTSLEHILTNKRYENIFLILENGQLLFSMDEDFVFLDSTTIGYSKQVFSTGQIFKSEIYYCKAHDAIHYEILAPVSVGQKTIAVMVFRIDPSDFLYPLIEKWPTPSKTAETLLVRRDGDSVTFINQLRHIKNESLTFKLPITQSKVSAVAAVNGHTGIFEGVDYRGEKVLSDISKIANTNWYLISEVDQDEFYAEFNQRVILIAIIVTIAILLVVVAMAWMHNYRQRNIYKELYEKRAELHESQELFRATLYSIGDGVITTDKKGLIKQLNPVAEKLTGWNEADALGKRLEVVFNIINEDTRENIKNPVDKVLKEGLIVGLANHTLLLSKNGEEIPISDSGAPIKDSKGNIIGVVMVFSDRSEVRNNILALEEREKRYSNLLDIMPDALFINKNNEVVYVNKACLKLFGADSPKQLIGKSPLGLFHPDFHEIIKGRIDSMLLNNQSAPTIKERIVRIDGAEVNVEVTATPFYDEGEMAIQVLLKDISERIRAEKAIHESSKQMRLLQEALDKLSTCVYMKDINSHYTFGNQATLNLFGCQLDELVGKTDEDFFSAETVKTIKSIDKRVYAGEQSQEEVHTTNSRGEESVYLELKTPIYCENDRKKVCGLLGISTDITKQKQTEKEILLATQQLKYHIENSPLAVIEWDESFRVKRWTARAEAFFGWSEEEVINKHPAEWNFVHEDDSQEVNRVMSGLISGMANKNISSNRNYAKDGSIVHCVWFNSALVDGTGKLLSILSLIHNITERKNVEAALLESEAYQKALIDSSPIAIYSLDVDGNIISWNRAAEQIFGWTFDEVKGKPNPIVQKEKQQEFKDNMRQILSGQGFKAKELVRLRKNGEKITISLSTAPIYGKSNHVKGIMAVAEDITMRKKTEESLRESEEKLSGILDNITDVVWSLTWPDMKPLYLSPSVEILYGRSVQEFLENPSLFMEIVHPHDQHLTDMAFKQLQKSGESVRECRIIRPDGSIVWIYDKSKLVYDENKRPVRVEGIAHDITKRKQAEQELLAFKNDLEIKVQEKTKELSERIEELERFYNATIDRELRMKELRDEIKRLKGENS